MCSLKRIYYEQTRYSLLIKKPVQQQQTTTRCSHITVNGIGHHTWSTTRQVGEMEFRRFQATPLWFPVRYCEHQGAVSLSLSVQAYPEEGLTNTINATFRGIPTTKRRTSELREVERSRPYETPCFCLIWNT